MASFFINPNSLDDKGFLFFSNKLILRELELRSSFFCTIRPLASLTMAYYRPVPGRTDGIPERSKTFSVTMDINPSLQILGWYVKGTGLG